MMYYHQVFHASMTMQWGQIVHQFQDSSNVLEKKSKKKKENLVHPSKYSSESTEIKIGLQNYNHVKLQFGKTNPPS